QTRPRYSDLLLSKRRRIPYGLSQRAKRIPHSTTSLSATDRNLSDCRRTTLSVRGSGGNSIISISYRKLPALPLSAFLMLAIVGCKAKQESSSGAPPPSPAQVIQVADMNLITIDKGDVAKFPLATAGQIQSASELTATATVFPNISREVPVISLANGRVVDIK